VSERQGWLQRHGVQIPTGIGAVLLPLRAFLAVVFLDAGISKIADSRFLDASAPSSMHATVVAARAASPIGGLLGPVQAHAYAFGVLLAIAEVAVGLGMLLGLLTRIAAAGGMLMAAGLWLTVSWGADPWFTSADLVYLFAFTPLLLVGAGGVWSLDAWLARTRERPVPAHARERRTVLAAAVALGGAILGIATLARGSSPQRKAAGAGSGAGAGTGSAAGIDLAKASKVPVGGALLVVTQAGRPIWVLQVGAGRFTAFDGRCPHQGCTVQFTSAPRGFTCPCHGSHFDLSGRRLDGPAPRGLAPISVAVSAGEVRTTG
jgi:thiosulfate dehydrogenase [quinone] large subunit